MILTTHTLFNCKILFKKQFINQRVLPVCSYNLLLKMSVCPHVLARGTEVLRVKVNIVYDIKMLHEIEMFLKSVYLYTYTYSLTNNKYRSIAHKCAHIVHHGDDSAPKRPKEEVVVSVEAPLHGMCHRRVIGATVYKEFRTIKLEP